MLTKFKVVETIPYESEAVWIVFAHTELEAKQLAKNDKIHYYDGSLSASVIQHNIRGTKETKVIKFYRKYFL